jgi:hypothetical protein
VSDNHCLRCGKSHYPIPCASPRRDAVWAKPLSENERLIIASVIDGTHEHEVVKKWLRHVVETHDALARELRTLRLALRENIEKHHNPISHDLRRLLDAS